MLFDDLVTGRQAQARAIHLSREKGRKDMRQIFVANAGALVGDIHPNQPPAAIAIAADMKIGLHSRCHRYRARPVHGLKGVFDQIQKYLGQTAPVAANRRQAGIEIFLDVIFLRRFGLTFEQEHVFQDLVNVERFQIELARPR